MPIRPENKHFYGPAFRALRADRIRETGNRCELCGVPNYRVDPTTGVKIVLTLAHWDHNPANTTPENMKLACQACHNRHDAPVRAKGRVKRRRLAYAEHSNRHDAPVRAKGRVKRRRLAYAEHSFGLDI